MRGDRLGPDVVLVPWDGGARVLDLGRGRFYALDPVGAEMLDAALELGEDGAARSVADRFDVPVERVRADLGRLIGALRRARLIVPSRAPAGSAVPGRIGLGLWLTWAWISLRTIGWARSVRLWGDRHPREFPTAAAGEASATAAALDGAVRDAAACHPLNPQCKERALVAWHLLNRRLGPVARLVVGAEFHPFGLHVWVECGGAIVTDDRARCDRYLPVWQR